MLRPVGRAGPSIERARQASAAGAWCASPARTASVRCGVVDPRTRRTRSRCSTTTTGSARCARRRPRRAGRGAAPSGRRSRTTRDARAVPAGWRLLTPARSPPSAGPRASPTSAAATRASRRARRRTSTRWSTTPTGRSSSSRTPPAGARSGRARRSACAPTRRGRCPSPSSRWCSAARRRASLGVHGRQRRHGPRRRGREPALPAAGQAVRGRRLARSGGAGAGRPRARRSRSSCACTGADGALVRRDDDQHGAA